MAESAEAEEKASFSAGLELSEAEEGASLSASRDAEAKAGPSAGRELSEVEKEISWASGSDSEAEEEERDTEVDRLEAGGMAQTNMLLLVDKLNSANYNGTLSEA